MIYKKRRCVMVPKALNLFTVDAGAVLGVTGGYGQA